VTFTSPTATEALIRSLDTAVLASENAAFFRVSFVSVSEAITVNAKTKATLSLTSSPKEIMLISPFSSVTEQYAGRTDS
jgi:hypothetical protein